MIMALTGTPGTGKTSVAMELRARGYDVIDINEVAKGSQEWERDEDRDTLEIDIAVLQKCMDGVDSSKTVIYEGHLSHHLNFDMAVVLRCNPDIIASRLRERGYDEEKVMENALSEALDVILCEAIDASDNVYDIDCTSLTVEEVSDSIESIINGNGIDFLPGKVDWTKELEKWC